MSGMRPAKDLNKRKMTVKDRNYICSKSSNKVAFHTNSSMIIVGVITTVFSLSEHLFSSYKKFVIQCYTMSQYISIYEINIKYVWICLGRNE